MSLTKRAGRDQHGAAAVEFALVIIPLVMLIFGILQFGVFYAQQLSLSNGARQGARLGVVNQTTCGAVVAEVQASATTLDLKSSNVSVRVESVTGTSLPTTICDWSSATTSTTRACLNATAATRLVVTARYNAQLLIPFVAKLSSIDLTGKGVYRCEYTA